MNRKTVTRIAFAAIVAPALAFGAPAAAMADSYFSGQATAAGPKGAASHSVVSVAKDGHGKHHKGGGSFFGHSSTSAGPYGASSSDTIAGAK